MKADITSKEDIKTIITEFYHKLLADDKMLPFFIEFIENKNLEPHLDTITDFWSDILLDTNLYAQNVMQKHIDKHSFIAFKKEHFQIWTSYLLSTIDEYHEGINAKKMKERALSIATVMQIKMKLFE